MCAPRMAYTFDCFCRVPTLMLIDASHTADANINSSYTAHAFGRVAWVPVLMRIDAFSYMPNASDDKQQMLNNDT
eukprot:1144966-Pelagomonas_calceolata.AAC.3